jgi:hypothetical protein
MMYICLHLTVVVMDKNCGQTQAQAHTEKNNNLRSCMCARGLMTEVALHIVRKRKVMCKESTTYSPCHYIQPRNQR